MSFENTVSVAIGIAIVIISITSFFFNKLSSSFLILAGTDGPLFHSHSAADDHNNASTETATCNLETPDILVTPSAGGKRNVSVTPHISLYSPVLTRMIPLSTVITPAHRQTQIIAQTHTTVSHVTLSMNKPANDTHNNITDKKNCLTRTTTKTIRLTSNKTPIPCVPRPSTKPALVSLSTQISRTKSVKKPPAVVAGTDYNNTKFVSKILTSRKPPLPSSQRPTTSAISHVIATNRPNVTPKRKQAELVKKPRVVVSGTDKNNTKSVNKYVDVKGNGTKPKKLTTGKPPFLCATRCSNIRSQTTRPTAARSLSTEIDCTRVAPNANRTKVAPNNKQAKPVIKPCVVVSGTDKNNTKSVNKYGDAQGNDTKPKMLTTGKPPFPCATRCSNIRWRTSRPNTGRSLSTETDRSKVTANGCIQSWCC